METILPKAKNVNDTESSHPVVDDLKTLMANTYILYVKTQNFHWNIIGPRFYQLHLFFESLYQELALSIDIIAEHVRNLQSRPPSSMTEFLQLTTLQESQGNLDENEMLRSLLSDNKEIQEDLKHWIAKSQQAGDEATADLMINRLRAHEKSCWMIRSHLESV